MKRPPARSTKIAPAATSHGFVPTLKVARKLPAAASVSMSAVDPVRLSERAEPMRRPKPRRAASTSSILGEGNSVPTMPSAREAVETDILSPLR